MSINSEDDYTRDIQSILRELNAIDYDRFTKSPEANFYKVREKVAEIFQLTKGWQRSPNFEVAFKGLSEEGRKSFLFTFLRIVRKMQKYNPFRPGDESNEDIAEEMHRFYDMCNEKILPQMRESIARFPNPQATEAKVKQLEQDFAAMREEQAVNKGASVFSDTFDRQARQNLIAAVLWLIASVVLAGVMGYIIWQIFQSIDAKADFGEFMQVTFSRVLLMSFLFVIFHHVVKNYNVNMHLYTLNRHRQNSIDSFEAFFKATKDSKTRDAILAQATKAIFEAGDTGYVSSKGGGNMTGIDSIRIAGGGKD